MNIYSYTQLQHFFKRNICKRAGQHKTQAAMDYNIKVKKLYIVSL